MDNEIKKMFEMILTKLGSLEENQKGMEQKIDGMEQKIDGMEQKIDGMEQKIDGMEQKINGMEQKIDGMEQKIDKNHDEVINKLEILESNQEAIKKYILNSDDTFKKVEDDHKFIQNLKNIVSQ